ncbi:NAD-dependent protein deacetylase hst4 [Dictyocoela muelleri]|nr:NAD-dependent protein deacetylase hst4 [Dictyocoela muelleri]
MKIIDEEFLCSKKFLNQKIVFIVGAGISVNAGIPDFRSASGIFAEARKSGVRGVDLFTYKESVTEPTRSIYLDIITKLRNLMVTSQPTLTHLLMKNLNCKKFRVYTQNIDCLEEKAGLKNVKSCKTDIVYLHGNLKLVSCIFCGYKEDFRPDFYKNGEVTCKRCVEENEKRKKNNRRTLRPGFMHPYIVHYQQNYPDPSFITKVTNSDRDCTLLIVIGTSLKIHGVKMLVKFFAKICKENNGHTIFVNMEEPNKEFKDVFDYMWKGDCDTFAEAFLRYHGKYRIIENYIKSGLIKIKLPDSKSDFKVSDNKIKDVSKGNVKVSDNKIKDESKGNVKVKGNVNDIKNILGNRSTVKQNDKSKVKQIDCEKSSLDKNGAVKQTNVGKIIIKENTLNKNKIKQIPIKDPDSEKNKTFKNKSGTNFKMESITLKIKRRPSGDIKEFIKMNKDSNDDKGNIGNSKTVIESIEDNFDYSEDKIDKGKDKIDDEIDVTYNSIKERKIKRKGDGLKKYVDVIGYHSTK